MKRTILFSVLTMLAGSVYGHDMFVDFGVGGGYSSTDLKFHNPNSTNYQAPTTKSGSYLSLANKDDSDNDLVSSVTVGYKYDDLNTVMKASYHDFGEVEARGSATFPDGTYEQKLTSSSSAAFVGMGTIFNVSPSVYLEATGNVGVSFIDSSGTQGENLGGSNRFPNESNTNLAWGVGAGVGYNLFSDLDLMFNVNYFSLGEADTGTTAGGGGMNADERLESELSFTTATISVRQLF